MTILNGTELLRRARHYADDTVAPYFIGDEEMYNWLNEAQRDLAYEGKLLREVISYDVEAYDADTATDYRWIKIKDNYEVIEYLNVELVDSSSNRYPMRMLGANDTAPSHADESDYGMIYATNNLTPGKPVALLFGKRSGYFELSPPSNAAYTVEATCIVYPTCGLEFGPDEPAIQERYHHFIPIGAALMAVQGSEDEHMVDRIQRLERQWQRGLHRASMENARMARDASTVKWQNDLWC